MMIHMHCCICGCNPCRCCGKAEDISLLKAVDNTSGQEGTRFPLLFDTNLIVRGNAVSHDPESPEFQLSQPGVYLVTASVTGNVSSGDPPASFTLYLIQDGNRVVDFTAITPILQVPNFMSVSEASLLHVPRNGSTVSFHIHADTTVYMSLASVSIVKIAD